MVRPLLPTIALITLAACTSGSATTSTDAGAPSDAAPVVASSLPPDSSCILASTSDLPGVHIAFAQGGCTFSLAQAKAGIAIEYDVVVDADLAGVVPQGSAAGLGIGPSGLDVAETLHGGQQEYCLCDEGLGPSLPTTPTTIKKGTYHVTFSWDGHNWGGPSDTGQPKGPFFPAGSYQLDVETHGTFKDATGTRAFHVTAGYRVTLTQ